MNSICHRCGGQKAGAFLPCPGCNYTPRPADRAVAWLFSKAYLSADELLEASSRIRNGEQPEPPEKLLQLARKTIQKNAARQHTDQGLQPSHGAQIAAMCVLLTPLAGFAYWWGYRLDRPTAARQVLRITWPITIAFLLLWCAVIAFRLVA